MVTWLSLVLPYDKVVYFIVYHMIRFLHRYLNHMIRGCPSKEPLSWLSLVIPQIGELTIK